MTRLRLAGADTFRSFHIRNFRLFFLGQFISQMGNWLTLVAQALFILRLTDNGVLLGGLLAAQFAPVLLIGPWAGLVSDRSDKRRLLLLVSVVAMAQSAVLAALAFHGSPPIIALYAVALVGGITVAFDNPARRAFVAEMVPAELTTNAVSLNSALMTGARVVGPAIAGLLITTVGFGWCFALDALSYVAVLVTFGRMRTSELRASPPAAKGKGMVRDGLRYARSVPALWIPLVMMAILGTLSFNFQIVFPLFVTRDLGGTVATYTTLFSVVSLGALAGALVAARRGAPTVRTVSIAAIGFGVSLGVVSLAPSANWVYPIGMVVGFASISFLTTSTSIIQLRAAPEMRGRVLAMQAMVFLGSTPIGGPILGVICEVFGARFGVAIGALAAVGAGVWGLLRSGQIGGAVVDAWDGIDHGDVEIDGAGEAVEVATAEPEHVAVFGAGVGAVGAGVFGVSTVGAGVGSVGGVTFGEVGRDGEVRKVGEVGTIGVGTIGVGTIGVGTIDGVGGKVDGVAVGASHDGSEPPIIPIGSKVVPDAGSAEVVGVAAPTGPQDAISDGVPVDQPGAPEPSGRRPEAA